MAQILVPGTAQTVLSGVYATQPWVVVWHFKFDGDTGNWAAAEIAALANAVSGGWIASAAPLCNPAIILQSVQATDIGSPTPAVFTNTTSVPGTRTGGLIENSSSCMLMSMHIAARYKGGHPRTYLPWGIQTDVQSEFQWSVAFQNSAASAMAAIISHVRSTVPPRGANSVSQVCPRYTYTVVNDTLRQKYIRQRTGLKSVDVIQNYTARPTFGVQRRRLTAG